MPCLAVWRALWAVSGHGNIGIAIRAQNAVTGLQMAFAAVSCFGPSPALLDTGTKIAACWP